MARMRDGRGEGGTPPARRRIAVSLHDIEPATFERCALIRDWLADHGVDRVTLLVIPARDLHPLAERSPELRGWLIERREAGDAIAQHGFQHERLGRAALLGRGAITRRDRDRAREFVGMRNGDVCRAVEAGWRLLKLAGLEPDGFVAPGYAYTRALHRALPARFRWWADRLHLYSAGVGLPFANAEPDERPRRVRRTLFPAFGASSEDHVRRAVSPALIRATALLHREALRLEVHPADLERPRHMLALESALRRAGRRREAVAYGDLLAEHRPASAAAAGAAGRALRVPSRQA